MHNIKVLDKIPRNWVDPILRAAQARALLAQPNHVLFSCDDKGLTGHLLARAIPGTAADVLTLFIREPHRRKGHAKQLLSTLIQHAKSSNCPSIAMEVRASNTPAQQLYKSLGFQPLTTRKGYYQEPAEDAVVYSLDLG
ncbi:MAG: GNAT family N-acetyltransferase [Proteobacteria bacterium]|nr:GNAT family N-acetyltransferase [Pseudomonadota bacterium]